MRLTITIDMDNAAFEDPDEAPRILRGLAKWFAAMGPEHREMREGLKLRDINGNTVGKAVVE